MITGSGGTKMLRMVLGIAIAIGALMPSVGMADDQAIADYIKSRLQVEQQRGNLRGFNVDMRVDRGTVWFKGQVANETQEKTILSTAQDAGHLGVVQVVDDIEIDATVAQTPQSPATTEGYTSQAGYQQTAPTPPSQQPNPFQTVQQSTQNAVYGGVQNTLMPSSTPMPFAQAARPGMVPAQQASAPMAGRPGMTPPHPGMVRQDMMMGGMRGGMDMGMYQGGDMMGQAPMPCYGGQGGYGAPPKGGGGGMTQESANLPEYAWPGYAASPNYAAVTYPQQYSASAWPYIGPFYPYPQVPLGWRKVTLEWDDGWWMLDFKDR